MTAAALAGTALVQAVGWTLLHFVWQGTLIAGALWIALTALPRAQALARYVCCMLALLGMALAPPVTLGLLLSAAPPPASLAWSSAPSPGGSFFSWLVAAWALGSSFMTARLALGVARLRQLVQRAGPAPRAWQLRLRALARQLGVRPTVRLLISDDVDSPLVLGWLRPVILVPLAALTALPPSSVEALLAHELGHVRRLDYLVNVLQACVEAALFYHPAVHWASRCMRLEREHCCDDIAISASGSALHYARALTEMETLRAHILEPALASKGGSLMNRIERILSAGEGRAPSPRVPLTAGAALVTALGLSLAGIWACSTAADDAAPARLGAARAALSIAWLPPEVQRWQPELAAAAARYDLDPGLLAIVTLVESLGDPGALSPGGAVGLMQVMPATAARIAAERQLGDYSEQRLLEPAYNVDFGAWYLSRQLAAAGGEGLDARSVALVAVGYNGGPRFLREARDHGAALPPPIASYRDLVVGMWNERALPESATYVAWRDGLTRQQR